MNEPSSSKLPTVGKSLLEGLPAFVSKQAVQPPKGKLCVMLTAIIIVARVQPGTSKGITDLLLPQPSSGLTENHSGPSSFAATFLFLFEKGRDKFSAEQEDAVTFVAFREIGHPFISLPAPHESHFPTEGEYNPSHTKRN